MSTRKTGHGKSLLPRPVQIAAEQASSEEIEIVHAKLHSSELLSLADDQESGTDPYNNTGQYAALQARKNK